MNVESYLRQGNCLDQRIRYNLRKLADLRKTVADVSAPLPRPDNVVTSRNTDALFVRALERVEALEERISREILLQTSLREQISQVVSQVGSEPLRLLLTYRYLEKMPWRQICSRLEISFSTAKRWKEKAFSLITLPENPIVI